MLIQNIRNLLTVSSSYLRNARLFCFYDKNLESFRNKVEYQNLVVPPVTDLSKTPGALNDETQMDGFFYHLLRRENVMKLSPSEVKDILGVLANSKFDLVKYASSIRFLDEKCALSAERWPLDLSFYILDAWFKILGPKIFRKHYYSAITSQWSRKIKKCSRSHLILALYFIGMSKSAPPFLMDSVLDRMENILPEFSDEEIAIACLSFFKCSKKIKSVPFLQRSCEAVECLLQENDQHNAISILKCLRLSKYQDAQLYKQVEDYVLKNYATFNLVVCTNFLALFATQNVYSKELFNVLEVQAITALNEEDNSMSNQSLKTHPSLRSRVKDFARLLWALTTVGHPVKEDTLTCITNYIEKRLELGEYESQLPILIDTLQSFVLTNHFPVNIFSSALSSSTFKRICNGDKAKPKYQLYFVEKSVQVEHPEISIHSSNVICPIPKQLEKEIRERKGFKELIEFLEKTFSICQKSCYIMPHIMIAGIFFSKPAHSPLLDFSDVTNKLILDGIVSKQVQEMIKKKNEYFCCEIFDSSVVAGGSNQAIGLMQTKIRQLKKLNFKVIVLSTDEINKIVETNVPQNCDIEEFFHDYLV